MGFFKAERLKITDKKSSNNKKSRYNLITMCFYEVKGLELN
ncbi:hypothetical protein BH23BAC1_BH23BAC1_50800 [soil metagenome]